jgi:hypothetical protein
MKSYKIFIHSLAFLMIAAVTASAAQLASAKVTEVTGTVTKYTPDGGNAPIKVGDILKEGDSISATALSQAELVFSNGSELTIEENTSVNIAKLQQESFAGSKSYEQLQADPSKSQTLLELNYGKLSGHVKKLRSDSQFNVETPLGTAAIRGTIWSMLLIYNAERQEFLLSVKNYDGLVDIISRYVGQFEYGDGTIGDKGYKSSASETTRELIPQNHTINIRIQKGDPYFDTLFQMIKNIVPTGPRPVITPNAPTGASGNEDDDLGIIVVSPEGGG